MTTNVWLTQVGTLDSDVALGPPCPPCSKTPPCTLSWAPMHWEPPCPPCPRTPQPLP